MLQPADRSLLIPKDDTQLVAEKACRAAQGARAAWHDVQSSLLGVANPLRMIRHHPVGMVLSVGAIAAVGTASVRNRCGGSRTTAAVRKGAGWVRRAVTGAVVNAILRKVVFPVDATCERADGGGPSV